MQKRVDTTPCIGRCSTTFGDEVCRGCGRTIEQIRDWNTYPREKQVQLTAELREAMRNKNGA